jgi:hypothetical protein
MAGLLDPVEMASVGGHIESSQVRTPEGAVGRLIGGHRMCLQDASLWRKDVYHRARPTTLPSGAGHNIPSGVQAHPADPPVHPPVIRAKNM